MLDEEINTNLSLQAKLKVDFGLRMPDVPEVEELVPEEYFAAIERIVSKQSRWKVHRNRMTVWFFSFAKFLMFGDLELDVWPEGKGPLEHPLVGGLLGEAVCYEPPLLGEDEPLDSRISPQSLCHVVDCDSSQAAAVEEVRGGRNLVIQGPPGTGKSQSIANVIASAVRDGRTVLFVAEKLAALQVVKSRLDRIGLGDICLELHSHKANRRSVLDDLDRTLNLGRPAGGSIEQKSAELAKVRQRLNDYVEQLHQPIEPSSRTPYSVIGSLCRLQADGVTAFDCELADIDVWSPADLQYKQSLLRDLVEHVADTRLPNEHAWRGVQRTTPLLPTELQSLKSRLTTLKNDLGTILETSSVLSDCLNLSWKPDVET
ncbi:MAG: AAA domain-containing protein, partial [Planctomycetaceae bacterium]